MPNRLVRSTLAGALLLAVGATSLTNASATPVASTPGASAAQPTSMEQIAALPLPEQTKILQPLRNLASALDAYGRSAGAATYAGVALNPIQGTVDLYLTDTATAATVEKAAKLAAPQIDATRVRVHRAKYTRTQLHAAEDRIWAKAASLPVKVDSVIVPADGSVLQLGVEPLPTGKGRLAPSLANSLAPLAAVAGLSVQETAGHTATPTSRYADTSPYVAGDYIRNSTGAGCTVGIPVQNASGVSGLVTASHCGHTGMEFYNGNGTYVGTVTTYSTGWDAALISAGSAAYEWDGGQSGATLKPLSGVRYSYKNDLVCQDGYTDGTICNIIVDNQDLTVTIGAEEYPSFDARGVMGHQIDGTCAVKPGDSGGLVWALNSDGTSRNVRGIVSGTGTNCGSIFWTEAVDIFNKFGVHLTTNS